MENLILILIIATFFGLLLLDWLAPARAFPRLALWRGRGVASFGIYLAISSALPLCWDAWLAEYRLFDLTGGGIIAGAAIGFFVLELGIYAWHRALHRVPFLWRWFHQMHHSAERVDVAGAFYFSPLDIAGFSLISSLTLVWVVGLPAESAIIAGAAATLLAIFQHANVRTPHWLGYLIARPEGHALHHERGVHAYNYTDLSVIDMLFGTWRNPVTWEGEAGFYDGASDRVGEMLIGRDVSVPPIHGQRLTANGQRLTVNG